MIRKKSKLYFNFLVFFSICQFGFGQERIDVAEQTIRLGAKSTETLYYGFAEGDQIIFSFEEVDEKEVKEVEIIEMPENIKFKDYETKAIKDKIVKVGKKGIFKFRFYNSSLLKSRVCRIKIQRIAKNAETANFNTAVKWIEKLDTSYEIKTKTVVIGQDTMNKQKSRRILFSTDTSVVSITDRVERVHSRHNTNGNVSSVNFQLPNDSYSPNIFAPYRATKTISWAYSLTVGESGEAWYKSANSQTTLKAASSLGVKAGILAGPYGALASLAIDGLSSFSNPPQGDNVMFTVYRGEIPTGHSGNSVAVSDRVADISQGKYSIRLENDNTLDGINVSVKVIAVIVTKTWKDEYYTVQETEDIKEKKVFKIPKIEKIKIPVLIDDN